MTLQLSVATFLLVAAAGCLPNAPHATQDGQKQISTTNQVQRAPYARVEIAYPHENCSYSFSPVNFCDASHVAAYEASLKRNSINFANEYILLSVPEREEYHQRSLVVVDPRTGIVYPAPIDAYAGAVDAKGNVNSEGKLSFSSSSNDFCINGSILVYRSIKSGEFCFSFEDGQFDGYTTQYMQELR